MVKMSGRTETDGICKQILENLKIFQKEIYEAEDLEKCLERASISLWA